MKITTSRPRMGPLRSLDKEQFWRATLTEQAGSGLDARAFCRQRGLSEPSFYSWRRTLAERDRKRSPRPPRSQTPTFVELRPPAICGAADVPLELVVGDHRLLIRAGCSGALLREVLAALAAVQSAETEA